MRTTRRCASTCGATDVRDLDALGQYAIAASVVGLSIMALLSAVVLRTISTELTRRGLGRGVLPTLRTIWLAAGAAFIGAGSLWVLDAAGVVDAAALLPFGLPALLIAVGVFIVTLLRRHVHADVS